jgi:hypothetical protein
MRKQYNKMKDNGIIKLFRKNLKKVRERVARKGKRILFNKKPAMLNATINIPVIIPTIKKEVNPTVPKYSGFKNKNCNPYLVPTFSVIIPKSKTQKKRKDLFFLIYITIN